MDKAVLIIVPGRDDRAFYKAFIQKMFNGKMNGSIRVDDLSITGNRDRRNKVLRSIFPVSEEAQGNLLWSRSVILEVTRSDRRVFVVIIPAKNTVTEDACQIIGFLGGVFRTARIKINTIVIAEDAEDMDFRVRLRNLSNSIRSRCRDINVSLVSSGNYYMLHTIGSLQVLVVVQGVDGLPGEVNAKHAIEDFIMYVYREKAVSKSSMIDNNDGNRHKKIALLIAIDECRTSVEKLFYKLTDRDMESLASSHDGLQQIYRIIDNLLK